MKEKKQMKTKVKKIEKYTLLIFLATLFMSIAFAKISDIGLTVTGTLEAKVQSGVFISNVTKTDSNGVISDEIKYYKGANLSTTVKLSSTSTSYVTYEITMYNNSAKEHYFKGVTYDANAYDNTNITYTLDGIEEYITTIGSKQEIKFNITFEYKDGITVFSNQTLNSLLKFTFSNEFIEFTVGEEKHTAPKGATWEQFVNSKYNTYGVYITDNKVYTSNNKQLLYTDEVNNIIGQEVNKEDIISETLKYIPFPEINLDKETIELEIEEGGTATETLTAIVDNTNLELTWKVEPADSGITITGEGNTRTITVSKAVENASITASYGIANVKSIVNVTEKIQPEIILDKASISKEITSGVVETETLTATLNNASGELTWISSDTSVVEISGTGNTRTITLKKAGTATITVSYGIVSATCVATVTEKQGEMLYYFNIDDKTYYAKIGTTWEEWVTSEYNTLNVYIVETIWITGAHGGRALVCNKNGTLYFVCDETYSICNGWKGEFIDNYAYFDDIYVDWGGEANWLGIDFTLKECTEFDLTILDSSANLISFTIDGTTYYAEEGMNWYN